METLKNEIKSNAKLYSLFQSLEMIGEENGNIEETLSDLKFLLQIDHLAEGPRNGRIMRLVELLFKIDKNIDTIKNLIQ